MVMEFFRWLFSKKSSALTLPGDWAKDNMDVEVVGPVITYRIEIRDGRKTITCLKCKMTSWSTGDVEHLYCANCKFFHERRKLDR